MKRDILSPSMAQMELKHLVQYTVDEQCEKHIEIMKRSFESKVKDLVYSGWISSTDRYQLSDREIKSILTSHRALAEVMQSAGINKAMALIQYFFPLVENDILPSRADAVLCGYDSSGIPNLLGVEMKNWSNNRIFFQFAKNETDVCLQYRSSRFEDVCKMPHLEAINYGNRIKQIIDTTNSGISSDAIAYLPNVVPHPKNTVAIHSGRNSADRTQPPNLFYRSDKEKLVGLLKEKFSGGGGREVANLFFQTRAEFMDILL